MGETVNVGDNITPESGLSSRNNEEGSRTCPLCSSRIRLFFVNLNEKVIMCENLTCDYPFGYEELQFVELEHCEELSNFGSSRSGSLTQEQPVSTLEYENVKSSRAFETETVKTKKVNKRIASEQQSEKQMKKNLEDLKGLTMELKDMSAKRKTLKNEKWIKNLMHLQDHSGFKLLKQEELKKMNKADDAGRELKIDIEPGSSGGVSLIKIAIAEQQLGADPGHVVT